MSGKHAVDTGGFSGTADGRPNRPGPPRGVPERGANGPWTKSIAAEWAPRGVRVVAIAPGRTLTNINSSLLDDLEKRAAAVEGIPAGRLAEASEMARLALLLASDVLNYVVGETVISDGGSVLL